METRNFLVGSKGTLMKISDSASSEKSERSGRGDFDVIFQSRAYPTDLCQFFFDNFYPLLGFGRQVPSPPMMPPLMKVACEQGNDYVKIKFLGKKLINFLTSPTGRKGKNSKINKK